MAKKKVHPLHRHHSFVYSVENHPFITMAVLVIVGFLLAVIYFSVVLKFKYEDMANEMYLSGFDTPKIVPHISPSPESRSF